MPRYVALNAGRATSCRFGSAFTVGSAARVRSRTTSTPPERSSAIRAISSLTTRKTTRSRYGRAAADWSFSQYDALRSSAICWPGCHEPGRKTNGPVPDAPDDAGVDQPDGSSRIDFGLTIAKLGIARSARSGPNGTFVVITTVAPSFASTRAITDASSKPSSKVAYARYR